MIKLGYVNTLSVRRKSDLGYMLTDGEDEVLLHFKESNGTHNPGDEVKVFIYSDKGKRPTATEATVYASMTDAGLCEVVEVIDGVGVFVNINTPKDVLISKDYLPYKSSDWPVVGDKLLIRLKLKHDILTAKPLNRFDIIELKSNVMYEEKEMVNGYVCRIAEKGIGIVSVDMMYIFVPFSQLRGDYRLGQEVSVTITKVLDNEYYGTMNKQKEEMIDGDKKLILEYLESHHGVMRLTAKSSSEDVESLLRISRKAFKRAYGGLYKDGVIEFDENKTYLKAFRE